MKWVNNKETIARMNRIDKYQVYIIVCYIPFLS